jgi:hypothetical protein
MGASVKPPRGGSDGAEHVVSPHPQTARVETRPNRCFTAPRAALPNVCVGALLFTCIFRQRDRSGRRRPGIGTFASARRRRDRLRRTGYSPCIFRQRRAARSTKAPQADTLRTPMRLGEIRSSKIDPRHDVMK